MDSQALAERHRALRVAAAEHDALGVEPGDHAPERAAARLRDALAPADLEPVHIESGRIDERQVHVRHAVEEYPVAPLAQMLAHIQLDIGTASCGNENVSTVRSRWEQDQ